MRCRAALEGLDDVHATAATRAWLGRLVGCRGTIGGLRLVRAATAWVPGTPVGHAEIQSSHG